MKIVLAFILMGISSFVMGWHISEVKDKRLMIKLICIYELTIILVGIYSYLCFKA